MLIRVGCGLAEIDAVTVSSEPGDFTQSDSQISNSILPINHVSLPSVYIRMIYVEVFNQYMAVLIAHCRLKARRGIRIDCSHIQTFSKCPLNTKVTEGHVGRWPRQDCWNTRNRHRCIV